MHTISKFENTVKLKPEIAEDLWHLEKIIRPGDRVSASTTRKFVADSGDAERKRVFITLECEKVEFHKGFGTLRVLGVIKSAKPEDLAQIGEHHSLDVALREVITIEKPRAWMRYEIERIREAEKASKRPKIAVLVMDEREAELFVMREYGIDELGKETLSGTGKYEDGGKMKEVKNKHYTEVYNLLKKVQEDNVKIIIAGPGFERENFQKWLKDKDSGLAKSTILYSTGDTGKKAVHELIEKDALAEIAQQSRFADEAKAVEQLVAEIGRQSGRAVYGLKQTAEALDFGAVEKLMVLDTFLFDHSRQAEPLLKKAEKMGSESMIISHENDCSQKLEALGSVAALLRFKVE
ncbi:MAG: mRNA surveillance protein pelota [Candidatus Micrarchaeota archaeon]